MSASDAIVKPYRLSCFFRLILATAGRAGRLRAARRATSGSGQFPPEGLVAHPVAASAALVSSARNRTWWRTRGRSALLPVDGDQLVDAEAGVGGHGDIGGIEP